MKFSLHKLSKAEAGSGMRRVPVRLFKPYTPMLAPVYAFLEKNEKFVAVKAPLNFFSPAELEKFRTVSDLYLPEFVERVAPFQAAGETVRRLLGLSEVQKLQTSEGPKEASVPVSPFQKNNAVLQTLGPLWGSDQKIEPFFLVFFASEVSDPLPDEKYASATEISVARYELALLRASFAVFLALHAGFLHGRQLSLIRDRVFDETVHGTESASLQQQVDVLVATVYRVLSDSSVREIRLSDIQGSDPLLQRIQARLERVRTQIIPPGSRSLSLYGEGGICGGE